MKRAGKFRILEKTPQNSLRPDFVHAVFPEAVFLVITRDPYATIASITSFWRNHTKSLTGISKNKLLEKLKQTSPQQLLPYAVEFVKRALPSNSSSPAVMWGPRLPGLEEMVKNLSLNEVAAHQWRQCMEYIFHFSCKHPNVVRAWALEDLNESDMREMMDFVGLGDEEGVIGSFREKFAYQKNFREKEINETFKSEVEPIIAPTLALFKKTNWPACLK